jgi:hypothetical protein
VIERPALCKQPAAWAAYGVAFGREAVSGQSFLLAADIEHDRVRGRRLKKTGVEKELCTP